MTSSTTGSLTPGQESPGPSHLESAEVNARGSALLASLIGFFRSTTPNADITRLCASAEGQQLLKTLGNFVKLVVDSEGNGTTDAQEVIDISVSEIEEHLSEEYRSSNEALSKESIPNSEEEFLLLSNLVDMYPTEYAFPSKLVEEVNKTVFNTMPIRMISFDSSGGSCTLVDRSTLVDIILTRIRAAYPNEQKLRWRLKFSSLAWLVSNFCQYAILSHTWLRGIPGDVLFHDWANRGLSRNTRGNAKIDNFCTVAACDHGVQLGWMDTVCINKESSAELDESIRSMYKWYQQAHVCIAYLADTLEFAEIPGDVWFTRGWTLQELVANKNIHFYNRDWTQLRVPAKFDAHLSDPEFNYHEHYHLTLITVEVQYQIFKATSITRRELFNLWHWPVLVPICRIMELAAKRKVTHAEDQVYSLMGLLEASIPIAYGEGSKNALRRMIQQIMISRSDFRDLFNHTNEYSILPDTITDYIGHTRIVKKPRIALREPILLSHLGIHATFLAIPLFNKDEYKDEFPANISMSSMDWRFNSRHLTTYIALDDSTDTLKWISNLNIILPPERPTAFENPPFIFLAILMSVIDQDHDRVQIPVGNNLGIPVIPDLLNPGHDSITTLFRDINPLNSSLYDAYLGAFGPQQIHLQYSGFGVSEQGLYTSTGEEIKRLGFRVISAYFR